jgi:hypothetical protein
LSYLCHNLWVRIQIFNRLLKDLNREWEQWREIAWSLLYRNSSAYSRKLWKSFGIHLFFIKSTRVKFARFNFSSPCTVFVGADSFIETWSRKRVEAIAQRPSSTQSSQAKKRARLSSTFASVCQ